MSIIELKALAFDIQQEILRSQNNLQLVGKELENKLKEEPIES